MTSEWTIATLKEHFEALLDEKDKALSAALIAVKEENRKTEIAAEKRFDLLNELRQGVATKEQIEALEKVVNAMQNDQNRSAGESRGSQLSKTNLYAGLGAVATGLGIIVLLANDVL